MCSDNASRLGDGAACSALLCVYACNVSKRSDREQNSATRIGARERGAAESREQRAASREQGGRAIPSPSWLTVGCSVKMGALSAVGSGRRGVIHASRLANARVIRQRLMMRPGTASGRTDWRRARAEEKIDFWTRPNQACEERESSTPQACHVASASNSCLPTHAQRPHVTRARWLGAPCRRPRRCWPRAGSQPCLCLVRRV